MARRNLVYAITAVDGKGGRDLRGHAKGPNKEEAFVNFYTSMWFKINPRSQGTDSNYVRKYVHRCMRRYRIERVKIEGQPVIVD